MFSRATWDSCPLNSPRVMCGASLRYEERLDHTTRCLIMRHGDVKLPSDYEVLLEIRAKKCS